MPLRFCCVRWLRWPRRALWRERRRGSLPRSLGGLQGVPLSAQEGDWISREEAIAAAKLQTYAGEDAETIQASLVRLSDTECPVLPESDITLTDRPAWVVTFHNVGIMLHGPAKGEPVQADVYVIVDAETGAWLETVSAPAQT